MRYLTFTTPDLPASRLGVLLGNTVIDLRAAQAWGFAAGRFTRGATLETLVPASLFELLDAGPASWRSMHYLLYALEGEDPTSLRAPDGNWVGLPQSKVIQQPPLARPTSLRDFYAFEQHVATAHANRDKEVPEEWYQFPVFYFSNPNAIYGPGEVVPYPAYTQALDYELEVACVIGRPGMNISVEDAESYIFGFTILNDWSARDVQRQEMKVGLGPAKGKDFASSIGPWLVTPDELAPYHTRRPGVYDLPMRARVNGEQRSSGNWKDIHFSFGELIARASEEVWLLPGDILGSGTVGTGCLLETTRGQGPWLLPGDVVELEIEGLGVLSNRIGRPRTK